MQITAQKRSLLNKLRESANIGGKATENFFNPEFKELMDRLRDETDDPVRAIISGEQIGNSTPPDDGVSLSSILKSARSNFNRREYMKSIADLSRFHKKMNDVVTILSNFNSNVDKIHEKFLFEGLDEDSKKYLQDLKNRVASSNSSLVKKADILDFFTNLVTERGRALAGWEKRYPKQIKALKQDTVNLISISDRLLAVTLSVLKMLAKYRAARNPDKYIEDSKKIIKAYENYNVIFKDYYVKNVKNFLEKQQFMVPAKTDTSNTPQQIGNQEVSTPNATQVPDLDTTPIVSPSDVEGPLEESRDQEVTSPKTNPAPPPVYPTEAPKMTPEEMAKFEKEHGVIASLNQQQLNNQRNNNIFYKNLQKMAKKSPEILSQYINKYAKFIQSEDPVTSIKLFKITQLIKG